MLYEQVDALETEITEEISVIESSFALMKFLEVLMNVYLPYSFNCWRKWMYILRKWTAKGVVVLHNNCATWWNILESPMVRMSAWLSSLDFSRSLYLQQQLFKTNAILWTDWRCLALCPWECDEWVSSSSSI